MQLLKTTLLQHKGLLFGSHLTIYYHLGVEDSIINLKFILFGVGGMNTTVCSNSRLEDTWAPKTNLSWL